MNTSSLRRRGEMAIVLGSGVWGLFWIPIRYLNDNHVEGLWAVAAILLGAIPISIAILLYRRNLKRDQLGTIAVIGLLTGLASALYFSAIVYTDVFRVVFLFYLLPIWATLLSRIIFGEKIGPRRLFAIVLALAGLWMLLGESGGWPVPQNKGDWMAIASGFAWAACLVSIRNRPDVDAYGASTSPFIFGAFFAITAALILNDAPFPSSNTIYAVFPITLAFGTILMWPSVFGQVWGARYVPPPRAALLTMTEILVATISAYFLIGTSLSTQAMLGGCIIICAVLIDITTPTPKETETTHG